MNVDSEVWIPTYSDLLLSPALFDHIFVLGNINFFSVVNLKGKYVAYCYS